MAIQDRFRCQIDLCEMWENPKNVVTNEMCGCTYNKECFEKFFRVQVRDRVLQWDFNRAGEFRCPSILHTNPILKEGCQIGDIVQNPAYEGMWQQYQIDETQSFNDLIEGCDAPFTALVPEYLRAIYQAKIADDTQDEGRRCCFNAWNRQVKESLDRIPAYQEEEWGICTKAIFLARCLYHVAVAIIFEVALFPVSFFVDNLTYSDWREGDVGDRITELYMQYFGCEYDYSRPSTFENRLIRWACGE